MAFQKEMRIQERLTGAKFVDAHVHVKNEDGLRQAASTGIVAVRHAGSAEQGALKLSELHRGRRSPLLVTSGWALYKRGGYGSRFGVAVETKKEIKSEIVKLKYAGADIIKVMASGVVSFTNPGTITAGGFTREELRLIVDEAEQHGLGVMAHANGDEAVASAVEARVRSIEHGFFSGRRTIDGLAKKGVFWVPTTGALSRAAEAAGVSSDIRVFVDEVVNSHLTMVHYAYQAGVPLAVGTDCVLPDPRYHDAYAAELAFFERAGIPRDETMRIASRGGAELLGIYPEQ
ncbi:MAG TPA: hypothetical protein DCO77_13885 [Nitrospiraceae bacterium]|nr:hypothetical protein [Nitrospiraceae bacterium]